MSAGVAGAEGSEMLTEKYEEAIEAAFWEFDTNRKRTGAERDAFKHVMRHTCRVHLAAMAAVAGSLLEEDSGASAVGDVASDLAQAHEALARMERLLEPGPARDAMNEAHEAVRAASRRRSAQAPAPIAAAPSHDLEEARRVYFEAGGIESDMGPRDDATWYWRRAAKLLARAAQRKAPPP